MVNLHDNSLSFETRGPDGGGDLIKCSFNPDSKVPASMEALKWAPEAEFPFPPTSSVPLRRSKVAPPEPVVGGGGGGGGLRNRIIAGARLEV